jgi:HEPN domain-containing protein
MDKKVAYWVRLSEYDLETAEAMLQTERFLYVGFMCHQAIEKIAKAHYQMVMNQMPPKTHNIIFLFEQTKGAVSLSDEQKNFLDVLQPMNIEARYPDYQDRIFKSLNHEKCRELLRASREMHGWIKEKLR